MQSTAGSTARGGIGIGSFRSCASRLVRGLVLEEACSPAGGTRAQRAHADAHRPGGTLPPRASGIVIRTHIDDGASVLTYDDLREVILAGTSSSGAVISGVADRVPERISQLVYIDAFVPGDGQAVFDLISPQRRPAMEALVESEGFGWLLPRYAAPPWEQVVRQVWQVADEADLRWMLARLRPTPFGHFTSPVRLVNPGAEQLPRTYIRCRGWMHPGFDRCAAMPVAILTARGRWCRR